MARKKRKSFTFESNIDKVIAKIEVVPEKVLKIVGQNIVREIRPLVPKRTGRLKKSLGYWARKKEKDLQIGFKIFYAPFVMKNHDILKTTVLKNAEIIKDMLRVAMDEIGKRE